MKILYVILLIFITVACTTTVSDSKTVSVPPPVWADKIGSHTCFTCLPYDGMRILPKATPVLPTITIIAKRKVQEDDCTVVNTGVLKDDINEKLNCAIKIILRGEN